MQAENGSHIPKVRVASYDLLSLVVAVVNDADYWFPGAPGIRHELARHASNPNCYQYVFDYERRPEDQDGNGVVYRYIGYTQRPRPNSPDCH